MPRQDQTGRWISDDGRFYWDGAAWRPLAAAPPQQPMAPQAAPVPAYAYPPAGPAPAQGARTWPGILIGCGIAAAIAIVLLIIGGALMVSSPDFQRGFCNGFTSNDPSATCPFHPPGATPSQ